MSGGWESGSQDPKPGFVGSEVLGNLGPSPYQSILISPLEERQC